MTAALSGLTIRGRAFVAAGGAATGMSFVLGQRDLMRVGILLLALPLVSLAVVARTRFKLAAHRTVEPSRVEVGHPASVRLTLENMARIPTGLLLAEDNVPHVLGRRPRFVLDRVSSRWTRDATYPVRSDLRGRYTIGPLRLRIADPFGLVELDRAFRTTDLLTVTPEVVPLPAIRLAGEWSGSGDSRPRAVAAAGEEDVTVREYRHGDDLRRVHWRATAHSGDLMVRREEQPWQSRCTLLLDTRGGAHEGSGATSSFEWAVSATASIGVHLLQRGYAVRLVTDDGGSVDGSWQDPGSGPGTGEGVLLDALAVVEPSRYASVGQLPTMMTGSGSSTGLLVALLGRLTPDDAALVAGLRHGSTAASAVLIDTSSWSHVAGTGTAAVPPGVAPTAPPHEIAASILRRAGWRVAIARSGQSAGDVWTSLAASPVQRGVA